MQSFIVWNNEIEGRLDCFFYSPKNQVSIKSKFPLVTVKDITNNVIHPPEYKRIYAAYGYQLLRAQNVKPLGIEINSNKVFLDKDYLKGKKLISPEIGDVLVVRSGANTGDCAVIEKDYVDLILGADNLVCKCNDKINPFFLKTYLSLTIGRKILNLYQTGATNYHITPENLKKIKIPLPPLSIQDQIVDIMHSVYAQKKQMEAEAQRLLNSIDSYVLNELGIKLPEVEDKKYFVVHVDELKGILSPHYFLSTPRNLEGFAELRSIAEINPPRKTNNLNLDTLVPYVGLPETDNFHVNNVLQRPYKKVKGRNIIKKGDILFARIEPSVFNKKYIFVDDLNGNDYAFTSTEFYIVKAKDNVNPEFLFYMFSLSSVYNQVIGKTTGSTGRRRLDKGIFEKLLIPYPPLEIQNKIADEVKRRISEAERLKAEVSKIIEKAKKKVEEMILGD